MELLLIRHALPVRRELVDGAADPELSADGHAQAGHLATYLSSEHLDAIYASPLQRAYQTASPIAAPRSIAVEICDGVAEYDRLSPDYVPVEELKAENDPRYHDVIGGEWLSLEETADEFRGRVVTTIEKLIDDHPGGRIAVVCHGGVINSYLCHVLGLQEPARLLLSELHQHQSRCRGAWWTAIHRDHQRDIAPARHRAADGPVPGAVMAHLDDLIDFLTTSPSPWHVVSTAADRLVVAGFEPLELGAPWAEVPARGFVVRGAALVAWNRGPGATTTSPLRLVGAHTDSPGLRVKPRPDTGGAGWKQLGVEVYGGALINSWLDRDLGIAGRVELRDGSTVDVAIDEAVCRVPQLAIHLDRDVNERGLVLDKQQHLIPVWGSGTPRAGEFAEWLGGHVGASGGEVGAWELCLFDRATPAILGGDGSLLAAGRLDNQLSCWAAVDAIVAAGNDSDVTSVIALFDHEEVGSESTTGAAGPMLEHVLERLALSNGASRADFLTQLAASTCVSADNAHAVHPNYRERHDPDHQPIVNMGPAIKLNSNQRYATSARSAAMLRKVFDEAGVPSQVFVSRNNMPCGTTIGPITATRLGIETVDVGVPQLSMHSARELCGVEDPISLAIGLAHYFAH